MYLFFLALLADVAWQLGCIPCIPWARHNPTGSCCFPDPISAINAVKELHFILCILFQWQMGWQSIVHGRTRTEISNRCGSCVKGVLEREAGGLVSSAAHLFCCRPPACSCTVECPCVDALQGEPKWWPLSSHVPTTGEIMYAADTDNIPDQ